MSLITSVINCRFQLGSYTVHRTDPPGPKGIQTLLWDTEGKLATTTEGTAETSYLYGTTGELLIRRAKGDGDTILYLGATEIRLTTKGTTKTLTGTRYYTAVGQSIAVRTATSGTTGTKLNFLAADHHGTSNIAMDATTWAITKRHTTPFGAPRGTKPTTWPDDKAFLGKPADTTTGLTHVGAREYDPGLGQFISVDPLLSTDQHQSLNGYSYARNAPATASDPSGLAYCDTHACPSLGDTPAPPPSINDDSGPEGNPGRGDNVGSGNPPPHCINCGSAGGGGGTAPTSSSGNTGGQCYYAMGAGNCTGSGVPTAVAGPGDTDSYLGNFLGDLLSNPDFWSGLLDMAGGDLGGGGGIFLVVTGTAECATGVLCVAGAGQIAGGAAAAAGGYALGAQGVDKLGQAFRQADEAGGSAKSTPRVNWSSKSVKTFGHTFNDHGKKQTVQQLADRAVGKGKSEVGQWLDDEAAAKFIRDNHRPGLTKANQAYIVDMPAGLGRTISQNGTITEAHHALIVPSPSGYIKTAYPVLR